MGEESWKKRGAVGPGWRQGRLGSGWPIPPDQTRQPCTHLANSFPSSTAPPSPSLPRPSHTARVPTLSSLSIVPGPPADSRPNGIMDTSESHTRRM